jgi:ribosomal protein S13
MTTISAKFRETYGINLSLAKQMCFIIHVSPLKPAELVAPFKQDQAFQYLRRMKRQIVGYTLQNQDLTAFRHYHQIQNTKSFKLKAALPLNGQRNKTNGRTARKNGLRVRRQLSATANASR